MCSSFHVCPYTLHMCVLIHSFLLTQVSGVAPTVGLSLSANGQTLAAGAQIYKDTVVSYHKTYLA